MSKKRKPPMWRRLVGGMFYGTVLLSALAAGAAYRIVKESKVVSAVLPRLVRHESPAETFHENALTLLLLGCDEELAPGGKVVLRKQARSDMILVAKLDFDHKRITGVSIPRDTQCQLPGDRVRKINAYHSIAKPAEANALTKTAVEHLLTGVHIDRVVTLDYDAFQQMVDMIGGVSVDVERKMDYDDNAGNLHIHLKPGMAKLAGYDAMCYVRYRHGDSDFKRQERQKNFLVSFKNAVLSKPTMIGEVADQSIAVLGNALSADEIAALALFAKDVAPQNIQMGQIPVVDGRGTNLIVNEDELPGVLAKFGLTENGSRVSVKR